MFEEKYISLRSEDNFIFEEIFVTNAYCVEENEIKDKIVIDIGANIGMFSMFVSEFKPKKIIAIEPEENNFSKLLNNIEKYKIKNIVTRNEAVSSNIEKKLYTVGTGGLTKTTEINNGTKNVKLITLPMIMSEFDDNDKLVLKIDCEGAEYDILLNLEEKYIQRFDCIYAEIHAASGHSHDELVKLIKSNGFSLVKVNHFYIYYENGQTSIGANKIYKFKKDIVVGEHKD